MQVSIGFMSGKVCPGASFRKGERVSEIRSVINDAAPSEAADFWQNGGVVRRQLSKPLAVAKSQSRGAPSIESEANRATGPAEVQEESIPGHIFQDIRPRIGKMMQSVHSC